MNDHERDEIPMLSSRDDESSDESLNPHLRIFASRTRSASFSIPMEPLESYHSGSNLVNHTGPLRSQRRSPLIQMSGPLYPSCRPEIPLRKNQGVLTGHESTEPDADKLDVLIGEDLNNNSDDGYASKNEILLRSGPLGMCNDPYCTVCPADYKFKLSHTKYSGLYDHKFHNVLYGDAKGWARRLQSLLHRCIPGVMNPHTKFVQRWNQAFVISCLVAIFVDPLFFFLISVSETNKCVYINLTASTLIVIVRSITDLMYLVNMVLQFRVAYIAPESRVVGAGDLVAHPRKIACHYFKGYFLIDIFLVWPVPQIMILLVLPNLGLSGVNNAKDILRNAILIQYIPRLFRFLPLAAGQSPNGFIFESAWANFVINLLTFMLAGHVVGSCWYLFGLQRVIQCFQKACNNTKSCMRYIDCRHGNAVGKFSSDPFWTNWTENVNATACFGEDFVPYGIYAQAVNLTTKNSAVTRYVYSLFWGFQQISTLAGNQVPSYYVPEVLFTMAIIGLGLLLFALLIGNMQNFLQALGRRKLEMQLRRRDVEQWMSHRRLPVELRRRVREAERYNWAATRGVNEEILLENLPENLQRDIRGHLFKFVKKVRIFALMDKPILDAICERLRQKTYISGSDILYHGGPVEKMIFIARGKVESIGQDGIKVPLSEGDVCGEELLTWCLEHSPYNKDGRKLRMSGHQLLSSRTVRCLTNVEAFALRESDIEEVTKRFARFLRNPRVQGAIRYESPYWRSLAATRIQVAWRYRKKCLSRAATYKANYTSI